MSGDALATQPAAPLDAALYEPLGGAEPMGKPLSDEAAMELGLALPEDSAEAMNALSERRERILELLGKHRDLRLYVRLFETETRLRGVPGFHAALHLLHAVLTRHWETLHPAPPEGDARIARMTAFGVLRQKRLIWRLDETVLFDAGGFDREIALRAFYLSTERHVKTRRFPPKDDETVYPVEGLKGIIARADKGAAVAEAHAALVASAALLRELGRFLSNCEGYESIRFDDLAKDVDIFVDALEPFLPDDAAPAEEAAGAPSDGAPAEGAAAAAPTAQPGQIATRAEAIALLDAILLYYAEEGRSSPIALALLKLRGMMDWTFDQWMDEVASDWPDKVALRFYGTDTADFTVEALAGEAGDAPADEAHAGGPPEALTEALDALESALASLREADGVAEAAGDALETAAAAAAAAREAAAHFPAAASAAPSPARPLDAGSIRSSADVKAALKRLAVFFRTAEPSSPAYLCFEKVAELVDRGFLDILRRVAPNGVGSAALILAQAESE